MTNLQDPAHGADTATDEPTSADLAELDTDAPTTEADETKSPSRGFMTDDPGSVCDDPNSVLAE
jgi:hypothetical protein